MRYRHAGRHAGRLDRLLGCLGVLVLGVFASGCPRGQWWFFPPVDPDYGLRASPSVLWIVPGETGTVDLTVTRAEPGSDAFYELVEPDLPASAPYEPADTAIDLDEGSGVEAVLTVATSVTTEPGIYRIRTQADVVSPTGVSATSSEALIRVVVLPGGNAPVGAVLDLAAGGLHSLALLEDGSVWAWGRNDFGQLGDGTLIDRVAPVPVQGLPGPAVSIAAGDEHSLAVLADGTVWGWGSNQDGQAGLALGSNQEALAEPRQVNTRTVDSLAGMVEVHAGGRHSLARGPQDELFSWGDNDRGQLGRPRSDGTFPEETGIAEPISHDLVIDDIALGGDHSLMVDADGLVFGWGSNIYDQLPLDPAFFPDVSELNEPRLADLADGTLLLGAGDGHSLFVFPDGSVEAVGRGSRGQLGDGSAQDQDAPVSVPRVLGVVEADGGFVHSLVRENDGQVHAFGANTFGQVGEAGDAGDDADQRVPVRVTGLPSSDAIAAGGRHSLSLEAGCGQIWAWGDDIVGQLGDGAPAAAGDRRPRPVPVRGLADPAAGGCSVSLAILTRGDGSVATSPGNIDGECASPCVTAVPRDDTVELMATPAGGASFLGWVGDCEGMPNPAFLDTAGDRICIAEFTEAVTPDLFDLVVRFQGPAATSGVVTVEPQGITLRPNVGSCDGTVCLVEDLTGPITLVPSTSDPLAFFMGWEPGVCDAIDGQECQLDLEADVDIEASFGSEG